MGRMSILRLHGLAAVALALFVISAPVHAGSEPEEPPTPTVLDATPEEVKLLMEHAAKGEEEKNNETLEAVLVDMETRRSEEFEPFIKKMMSSKARKLQARAIRAAASNEMEGEKKAVLKLLK